MTAPLKDAIEKDPSNREIVVALAGNPNCGKTSLFNHLTGARQRVGNFSGVTVERKEGYVEYKSYKIRFVDLPGIYSMTSGSLEEIVSRDYMLNEKPDLILNVLDAGNLERNLLLTTQLIEMDRPRIHCLNMIDEARAKGIQIDTELLATLLGGPVVVTVGRTGEGVTTLLETVIAAFQGKEGIFRRIDIRYDLHVESAIAELAEQLQKSDNDVSSSQAHWMAVKLLEGDDTIAKSSHIRDHHRQTAQYLRKILSDKHSEDAEFLFTYGRYGFIEGLLTEVIQRPPPSDGRRTLGEWIDVVLLNRLAGIPIFLFFMWLMFEATFTLGSYPMDWIDGSFSALGGELQQFLPESKLKDLVINGIIAGIGSTLVFLPNVVILFFFISLFEDTGYMARVAFMMDRFMHGIGLHGKAFIPMIMGFGCNVPAIMATRTMENPKDRLITILINPFISCSARLPVHILFAGAFFASYAGTVVFSIYLLGIVVAMGAALLLKKLFFSGGNEPFVMELPPYRIPTLRSVVIHMWERATAFLKKVSGVIMIGSVLIWFIQSYPQQIALSRDYGAEMAQVKQVEANTEVQAQKIADLELSQKMEEQEKRYLGQIGHALAPVFAPMGFGWQESVALLSGFIAKEIVVSTLGVLYHVGEEAGEESKGLRDAIAQTISLPSALAFMVFSLLYMPCLATIGVIRKETNSWRWALFSILFGLTTAWILSFLTYRLGSMLL